jgi:hypothetical protein
MKKGLQITALATIFTFLLIGTAMARPFDENMMQWDKQASNLNGDSAYAIDTQSQVNIVGFSQNQGSNLWYCASRFTRIQQVVKFAEYQANLTVTIQSMLKSVKQGGLVPTIAFEFVW